jgi:hypothetical protein
MWVALELAAQERNDGLASRVRVIDERPVATVGEDYDFGAGKALLLELGLLDGDPDVVGTPQDERRRVHLTQAGSKSLEPCGR